MAGEIRKVAVIGAGDDDIICEASTPQLSSVVLPGEEAGLAAAQLLARFLDGQEHAKSPRLLRPSHVAVRRSSDLIAIDDVLIARALAQVDALIVTGGEALALLLATGWPPAWSIPVLMAGIGFLTGVAGPSRDLLVRRAAVGRFGEAAYGRIYGFVYSGLDLGLATAPLIFGRLMDSGNFSGVLFGIAIFQALAIFTALRVGKAG